MTLPDIEKVSRRLLPVNQEIANYDAVRPLNRAARLCGGIPEALHILWSEALELNEERKRYDEIPLSQLNGGRKKVAAELGDVVFGLAQYFRLRGNGEMGRSELILLGGVVGWIKETEEKYHLDMVACGVGVNRGKNPQNNPAIFYTDYHPLDSGSLVVETNATVRRGLRNIRDMNSDGVLTDENLNVALGFWGYTREALYSGLALEFITKVARDGVKL